MDPSFERLPEEKRIRIIEGVIQEFAEYGYDAASTNRIVQRVGISKGSLFHYFNSKDELWLYTAEFTLKKVIPLMKKRLEKMPPDILERLKLMTGAVIAVYVENPLYYRFFMSVLDKGAEHMQKELLRRNEQLMGILDFFSGVDASLFRTDVQSTFLLIKWLYSGIKQELFDIEAVRENPEKLKQAFLERLDSVLSLLRTGIYR